jgi:hypothetical protein
MSSPRRDHYLGPSTDDDTAAVLDDAVALLGTLRLPTGWLGDAGVELHLLASLIAETERRLPGAVAAARDQDLSWAEIGDLSAPPGPRPGSASPSRHRPLRRRRGGRCWSIQTDGPTPFRRACQARREALQPCRRVGPVSSIAVGPNYAIIPRSIGGSRLRDVA